MPGGHHPRRTVEHRTEVIRLPQLGFAGRQPHPHRQLQRPLRGYRRIDGRPGRGERGAHPITGVLEQPAAVRLDRPRNTSSWAASAFRMPSASASHRRVEPSTSVNRNVTTPEGAAAAGADTPAESHNRHAVTPCRVHSRIASRASCAQHPEWHNWHTGAAVLTAVPLQGGPPSRSRPDTSCKSASLSHEGSVS